MSDRSNQIISLKIIIEKPLPGILYGLQKGSGSSYVTEQAQLSGDQNLVFELALPVPVNKGGRLVFSGPFAQGSPKDRFLYIGLGSYAGQKDGVHHGRLKVPLPEVTEDLLADLERSKVLMVRFPGTDPKNDRPKMATVKPEEGWSIS